MNCGDCKYSHDTGTALLCWGQRFAPPVDADYWCEGWRPKSVTPKTNYDIFISKTPEELAKFITDVDLCELLCGSPPACDGCWCCEQKMLSWLKSPVEEGE